ncbi:HAD family phosphatase [Hyphobacterium sp. CCMP332]|nr:HAD family phosphatase [Hyphobacterium sp. CCMP332]
MNISKNIRLILFDLGGVIIDIDWKKSVKAFAELTGRSFEELNHLMRKEELVQRIETGKMDSEGFRNWFCRVFNNDFENAEIDNAWNAMLLDIPLKRIELIKTLKENYSVMCLSNTNEIHINELNSKLSLISEFDSLENLMDKTYYSHLLKTRKPEPRAWEIILNENQLTAESVLYFDDNERNHQVAKELGFNSVLIDSDNTIEQYFNGRI